MSGPGDREDGRPDESTVDGTPVLSFDGAGAPSGLALGKVGPYHLRERLGRGGMGEVYLAEQLHPIRRLVALKVIREGLGGPEVMARFDSERQALALMDHPSIARVLDAGSLPGGYPFFAMEVVRGEPITAYADSRRLTLRQRLELFALVCDGVHHAHQKAILHRDLKPSNVLVTEQDGHPVPKIIDFGLAKALAQPLTEQALQTRLGDLVGTPAYMSPEQAAGRVADLDTRADVYALGVILYELLSGRLPFDVKDRPGGLSELQRRILEEDPATPSTRVASSVEPLPAELAAHRRADVAGLTRSLKGELDWIAVKALEKDRSRRYGSVVELSSDVRRYLRDEPVSASPPGGVYRARKFVRRHRVAVFAAAAVAVVLAGSAVTVGLQARRVAAERDRASEAAAVADEVSAFMVELFRAANPTVTGGKDVTARALLDEGRRRIATELKERPRIRARLLGAMGTAYGASGRPKEASELIGEALRLGESSGGLDRASRVAALCGYAEALRDSGREEEAERTAREAIELAGPGEVTSELRARQTLGMVLAARGQLTAADAELRKAYELARRLEANRDRRVAQVLNARAILAMRRGDLAEAEPLMREAVETTARILGEQHPSLDGMLNNLAVVHYYRGDYAEAERLNRKVLERFISRGGEKQLQVFYTADNLGEVLYQLGRFEEAEASHRRALAIAPEVVDLESPDAALVRYNLANALLARGGAREADSLFRSSLRAREAALGAGSPEVAASLSGIARACLARGDVEAAEAPARRAEEIERAKVQRGHPEGGAAASTLGAVRLAQGRFEEAAALLEAALEARKAGLPAGDWKVAATASLLGEARLRLGNAAEAVRLLTEAVAVLDARNPRAPEAERAREALARARTAASGYTGAPARATAAATKKSG